MTGSIPGRGPLVSFKLNTHLPFPLFLLSIFPGLHSNGYSLVRKILELHGLALNSPCPFDKSRSFGEVLLTPTKIYVKSVLPLMKAGNVKAFVHVTGM